MEFEDVLRFINLFVSGVAAGVLIIVMIAVMPALMTFPPSTVVPTRPSSTRSWTG